MDAMIQRLFRYGFPVVLVMLSVSKSLAATDLEKSSGFEFFEKKIRPLLAERCYECHSGGKKIKGGLRLDFAGGVKMGGDSGAVVVPGDPGRSLLYEAVTYTNVDFQMPPKSRLSDDEVGLVFEWIRMGAPYPDSGGAPEIVSEEDDFDIAERLASHWWKSPPQRPQIPDVVSGKRVRNPVDAFVIAKLEKNGLTQAMPADRRALVRRLYLDLVGLPPSPEDTRKWTSPESDLTEMVDSLLESEQFGEKWGLHWLDLVRYCETLGHEFDYVMPNAWRYRDYVIRAYNDDLPYDAFVTEHLAGDLVASPRINPADGTNESIKGTSFYWLGQQVHSPVDILANQAEVTDNQVDVMTKTFMGLTVSCARCHDHKFDAISTRDYYALFGTLTSSRYHQISIDGPEVRGPAINALTENRNHLKKWLTTSHSEISARLTQEIKTVQMALAPAETTQENQAQDTLVFDDFETGEFGDRWQVEGEAFGIRPIKTSELADYQGTVANLGQFLLNSHNRPIKSGLDTPSDSRKGSLTSSSISVRHRYLHFLIGGGNHRNRTGLQVLHKGKVVRHQTGINDNRLRPATIELADLIGEDIQLKIIDQHEQGWGNTAIDHIVFSNVPVYFSDADNQPIEFQYSISELSQKSGISEERLANLIKKAYEGKSKSPDHILNKFWKLVSGGGSNQNQDEGTRWPQLNPELPGFLGNHAGEKIHPDSNKWVEIEDAFERSHVAVGEPVFDGDGVSLAEVPGMHSGRIDPRLEGTASGPTFVIEKPFLHVLSSGRDARINVVMENFNVIRGPIYGGIKKKPNWESPRWMTFDLSMWIGKDAYLQINDLQVNDLAGPGSSTRSTGAIYTYMQSGDRSAPPVYSGDQSGGFANLSNEAIHSLGEDQPDPAKIHWLNQLMENGLVDLGEFDKAAQLIASSRKISDAMPAPRRVAGMIEGYGRNEKIAIRGNPKLPGEEAERGYMEAFHPKYVRPTSADSTWPEKISGSGRWQFAEWLTDKQNPLTSRVYVNRIWYHLFGEGIVASVDDMGLMGQEPTHRELLDWLADWFVNEGGWSTKKLIKLLVSSSAYQMSAQPEGSRWAAIDPTNRLLHSAKIRRLPAEIIRDSMLVASGSFNPAQFGASVPINLTNFMEGRGRPGRNGPLDGEGRRSIYVEVRRNFLSPMLLAFDKPIPFSTVGRRSRSNVPAQALILMNDPFVKDQAEKMANLLLQSGGDSLGAQITSAYMRAFSRLPSSEELEAATEFYRMQAELYPEGERKAKAMADLCHTLFNLKEFIFIQ